ncbi:helix-turn-helix transcriptional regulator [Nostocaceae cyanobacterium CENA369]|uniref:Helix-turn-helix transcriptional regulator n=1 Tax=Dendronalium phyllosphericum CENA369 TaxID=1725256 RepID=A0A8J7I7B7_9NOST|nr:helix-turn-helix transcriptional regulator [Dendronalium phyllosphericum]MBH8575258.1 helix-turn-helix transcriptional regulator [Dendronalium phyllosphericum CENA369]
MIALTKTLTQTAIKPQQPSVKLHTLQQAAFLQEVLEGLGDGILIVTETGELVHANAVAYHICYQLNQANYNSHFVPSAIWDLCQSLLDSRSLLSPRLMMLSDEIALDKSTIFHIRVRLLYLDKFQLSCLLVTIENRYESLKNTAIAEIKKYELTSREAEIWYLYRENYSCKEMAAKLYITLNTVKKHMKNIHAKRQYFLANHH